MSAQTAVSAAGAEIYGLAPKTAVKEPTQMRRMPVVKSMRLSSVKLNAHKMPARGVEIFSLRPDLSERRVE